MKLYQRALQMAAVAMALWLIAGLAACQTEQMARRSFPPDKRVSLQSGGPHAGTAETMTVIVNYRYRIEAREPPGRIMQIEGGINRFMAKKPESLTLHLNFLDDQGVTISRNLVFALGHKQGRDTFIRPSTTFATQLAVPPDSVFFALSSRTRLSRGRR